MRLLYDQDVHYQEENSQRWLRVLPPMKHQSIKTFEHKHTTEIALINKITEYIKFLDISVDKSKLVIIDSLGLHALGTYRPRPQTQHPKPVNWKSEGF